MKASGPNQVAALIEPPSNAFFPPLVPHGPRLEHTPCAHNAGNAAAREKLRKAMVVPQPYPVVVQHVRLAEAIQGIGSASNQPPHR